MLLCAFKNELFYIILCHAAIQSYIPICTPLLSKPGIMEVSPPLAGCTKVGVVFDLSIPEVQYESLSNPEKEMNQQLERMVYFHYTKS